MCSPSSPPFCPHPLTLSLQHLQRGLCPSSSFFLGLGEQLPLLLHPLFPLLLLLLFLFLAFLLQTLLTRQNKDLNSAKTPILGSSSHLWTNFLSHLLLSLPLQFLQLPLSLLFLSFHALLLLQKQKSVRDQTKASVSSVTTFPSMPHLLHLGQGLLHGLDGGFAGTLLLLLLFLLLFSLLLLLVLLLLVALGLF